MMPEQYKIHFESENLVLTRTGASLYLMYYQVSEDTRERCRSRTRWCHSSLENS